MIYFFRMKNMSNMKNIKKLANNNSHKSKVANGSQRNLDNSGGSSL